MAVLPILHFPDPRLQQKAELVASVDAHIERIVADMFETMYVNDGVGLAATQVGINQRIIVIDVSETRNQPLCVINPEIIDRSGEQFNMEGCLSVKGVYERVKRAQKVILRALDREGKPYEMVGEDLLAACIQHEINHIDGILFIDHLSPLKRDRARKKLEKYRRNTM